MRYTKFNLLTDALQLFSVRKLIANIFFATDWLEADHSSENICINELFTPQKDVIEIKKSFPISLEASTNANQFHHLTTTVNSWFTFGIFGAKNFEIVRYRMQTKDDVAMFFPPRPFVCKIVLG